MGSPVLPLGNVTNPLASVIDGLLTGHNLGLQMRQAQMQEAQFNQQQQLRNQQIQANDEQQRQQLINNARPVNSGGMVLVPNTDPRVSGPVGAAGSAPDNVQRPTLQQPSSPQPETQADSGPWQGIPSATLGVPDGQGFDPQLAGAMTPPYPVAAPPSAPAPAATPGATPTTPPATPQASPTAPQGAAGAPAAPPGYAWVKADASRLVKYKDSQGNVFQGELYTPQEQAQRQLAAKVAAMQATQVPIAVPDAYIKQHPGTPTVIYSPAASVAKIMKQMEDDTLVPAPKDWTLLTGEQEVRQSELAGITRQIEQTKHDIAGETNTTAAQKSREKIAEENRAAADARLTANNTVKQQIAADRNKTVLQAAAIRHEGGASGTPKPLTPGQQGVQGRFEQREIDADTKIMNAAQVTEQKAHALRTEIGAVVGTKENPGFEDGDDYADPLSTSGKTVTMNPLQRARLKAEYDKQTALIAQLQAQQKAIRQKHQWGEFAPQPGAAPAAGQPQTQPTQPTQQTQQPQQRVAPSPAPAPNAKEVPQFTAPNGRVIQKGVAIKLANGQTVTPKKVYADGRFDY